MNTNTKNLVAKSAAAGAPLSDAALLSAEAQAKLPAPVIPHGPQPGATPGPEPGGKSRARGQARPLFDPAIVRRASSIRSKLDPRHQVRNPVMFVVEVGSVLTTGLWVQALVGTGEAPAGFIFAISVWLWFTVLFANFAEAMAEGRGKAQADSLRKARKDIQAKQLSEPAATPR